MTQKNSKNKRTCTICTKEYSEKKYQPFCSKRCADVDLGKWLGGQYAIAGSEEISEEYDENQEY